VFDYLHFLNLGELKMRFLLNPTFVYRLCIVNDFGYLRVGIRKMYEAHIFPFLLLLTCSF